jgi:hypothetical protein
MLAVHADGGQAGAAVALVQSMRRAGVPFDAVSPSPIASSHNEPCCLLLIIKAIRAVQLYEFSQNMFDMF